MPVPTRSQTVAHTTYSNSTLTVAASTDGAATRPGSRIRVRIAENPIVIAPDAFEAAARGRSYADLKRRLSILSALIFDSMASFSWVARLPGTRPRIGYTQDTRRSLYGIGRRAIRDRRDVRLARLVDATASTGARAPRDPRDRLSRLDRRLGC